MKTDYLLFIAFAILLSSCGNRTDQCSDPSCVEISIVDSSFKQHWNFKEGSWWAYHLEQDPSIKDTVRVVYYSRNVNNKCNPLDFTGPPCAESFHIEYHNSNLVYFPRSNPNQLSTFRFKIFVSNNHSINFANLTLVDSSFRAGSKIFFSENSTESYRIVDHDNITIDSKVYSDISHFQPLNISNPPFNTLLEHWWSKDIGIVKYTVHNNRTWILDGYDINN